MEKVKQVEKGNSRLNSLWKLWITVPCIGDNKKPDPTCYRLGILFFAPTTKAARLKCVELCEENNGVMESLEEVYK